MPKTLTTKQLMDLRVQIANGLSHIASTPKLKKGEVIDALQTFAAQPEWVGKIDVSPNQLRYLVDRKLVQPQNVKVDGQNIHLYGREHICDVLFIAYLHTYYQLSYTVIATHLRDMEATGRVTTSHGAAHEVRPPQQYLRGLLTIRSRIVNVVLHEFLGSYIPSFTVVRVRQEALSEQTNGNRDSRTVHFAHKWVDLTELDRRIGSFHPSDVVGWVSADGEVLFSGLHQENTVALWKLGYTKWLSVQVDAHNLGHCYRIWVGFIDEDTADLIHYPDNTYSHEVMALLLQMLFIDMEVENETHVPADRTKDYSTPLQTLTEFVPQISPDWEYCAVLTPNEKDPSQLRISAASAAFPADMEEETLVWNGQPVSGWVFQWNTTMLIQHAFGVADPRIARQEDEKTSAAIGLPTRVHGVQNGVLYVGTRKEVAGDVCQEAQVRVLSIIADLIGETLDRNRSRGEARLRASSTIRAAAPKVFSWSSLWPRVVALMQLLATESVPPQRDENLQFIAVQVKVPEPLQRKFPEFTPWMTRHVMATTRELFDSQSGLESEFYLRDTEMSGEFVCLFPRRDITDEQDRTLRDELRKILNSLKVSYAYEGNFQIVLHVWSMPFRLQRFYKQLQAADHVRQEAEAICAKLKQAIETSMSVLVHIENGHREEKAGNLNGALREFIQASMTAPESSYVVRHIAKYYAAMGNYSDSVKWWERLLAHDNDPKNYRRYASSLARSGRFDLAEENYAKAYCLDPADWETLIEIGDFFLARGLAERALENYELAVTQMHDVPDKVWLRFARAKLTAQDSMGTQTYANLVLQKSPDDLEARFLLLQAANMDPFK